MCSERADASKSIHGNTDRGSGAVWCAAAAYVPVDATPPVGTPPVSRKPDAFSAHNSVPTPGWQHASTAWTATPAGCSRRFG